MEAFMSFFNDFFTCCQAKLHFVTASSNLKAAFLLVRGSHPTCFQGPLIGQDCLSGIQKKLRSKDVCILIHQVPYLFSKKNTSLFLKSPQGPKNKLLHFIELKSRNLPVESRTFFWNCAANSRIKHSSMSRPPTRSEVSLSTRSLPRTNSTMLTEKIEWPMEQNLQLMGEPKWVKKSLHTSLNYHYSLWLLGWPHLIVSLMA